MAVKAETPNDTKTTDRIEKRVVPRAPRTRVWRAIADAAEFGTWFRVNLEGAFTEGRPIRGRMAIPGYEHLTLELLVEAFRMNDQGWAGQMKHLERYVA